MVAERYRPLVGPESGEMLGAGPPGRRYDAAVAAR